MPHRPQGDESWRIRRTGADPDRLAHHGERLRVTGAAPVSRPMPPVPDPGPEPPSPPGRRPARRAQAEVGGAG
ncbi:hypothetical protein [Micromonospora sp. NPDC005299]|uniref:hypothetical protein n=1 Tax=Micromonospora sp. NPDC005299 TaxID=3364231 RepID=UPI0036C32663